ncbi:MAG TPA: glycosyltransferase family 4 protein [Planctomycetota bacterium]|jgi:phosphatidylinositol alpha-1,6-mannosyltransferase|nr:glycosyltransferase family 4 protein [Planctomycetota bacterium]
MRVLFLTDSLSDLDGVGRYAVRLITALEKARPGLEVRILLARKHRPTSADVPAHWHVSVGLPPDYFFHMSPPRFWTSLAAASLRVSSAAEGADLVHAIKDYPHSLAGVLGARLRGIPCVATAHGTYSVQPLLARRHAGLARWTYAHLAGLVSVSRYTRDRLVELAGTTAFERLRVIPNAVSAEHYAAASGIGPRAWHAHPFTLSIGEIKERKGHHLALAAFARVAPAHPDLHHYVVGKAGGDPYATELLAGVRAAGLAERVHFLGNVDESEKIDLLQRTRVFLLTPVQASDGGFEGFGIVYLEAAACGRPAIGTRGCGAEDAVVHGVTGLLVEPNEEAVAAGLERLLSDESFARSLGKAARERALQSSWDANARSVLALYDEILGAQDAPRAGVA